MPLLHIIEGPVGAGKTTYANNLGTELKTPPLVLDDWMATLFKEDRPEGDIWPWYQERKARCKKQIWNIACGLLETGHEVVVELGLIKYEERLQFYSQIETAGYHYTIHVLEVPKEERWHRVQQRNEQKGETFSMEVSQDVFNLASEMWEPFTETECTGRDVVFVNKEGGTTPDNKR